MYYQHQDYYDGGENQICYLNKHLIQSVLSDLLYSHIIN